MPPVYVHQAHFVRILIALFVYLRLIARAAFPSCWSFQTAHTHTLVQYTYICNTPLHVYVRLLHATLSRTRSTRTATHRKHARTQTHAHKWGVPMIKRRPTRPRVRFIDLIVLLKSVCTPWAGFIQAHTPTYLVTSG